MRSARNPKPTLAHPSRLWAVAFLTVWLAAPAMAQNTETQELKAVERALEQDRSRAEALAREAEALKLEIRKLRDESIAAARQAQSREDRLTEIESRLATLERQEMDKRTQLRGRHQQLTGTLAALQRIALVPPDVLLVAPGSPVETLRSAMLLRVAIPAIENRASVLRGELVELARLHQQIALQRHDLAVAAQDLESERARLGVLIQRKRAARAAATSEQQAAQKRAAKLAAQAKDLRDLLAQLDHEAKERVAREEAARQARAAAAQHAREQAARLARDLAERQARERAEAQTQALAQKQAHEEAARAAQELAERQARERAEAQAQAQAVAQQRAQEEATRAAEAREETTQLALVRPDNVRPFPDTGASLRMPARGRVVRRYGQSGGTEGTSKGINIKARNGAQVVAPYDGQVVYAGPFRGYGQILIIEHGGRYHTLLAGLDRIDAVVGQWLLAGEPVGTLSSPPNGNPELYFELRRAGEPINPLPWLATTGDKVRG